MSRIGRRTIMCAAHRGASELTDSPAVISGLRRTNPMAHRAFFVTNATSRCVNQTR